MSLIVTKVQQEVIGEREVNWSWELKSIVLPRKDVLKMPTNRIKYILCYLNSIDEPGSQVFKPEVIIIRLEFLDLN